MLLNWLLKQLLDAIAVMQSSQYISISALSIEYSKYRLDDMTMKVKKSNLNLPKLKEQGRGLLNQQFLCTCDTAPQERKGSSLLFFIHEKLSA